MEEDILDGFISKGEIECKGNKQQWKDRYFVGMMSMKPHQLW